MILHKEIEEKINRLLSSDIANYLETSERLILKNIMEKETISEQEHRTLENIIKKYEKFIKN